MLDNGKTAEVQIKEGQIVLFTAYAGTEVEIGDDKFLILNEGEVLAVIQ